MDGQAFCLRLHPYLILLRLPDRKLAALNTAVAFGHRSARALYPIIAIVREMTGDKLAASLGFHRSGPGPLAACWGFRGGDRTGRRPAGGKRPGDIGLLRHPGLANGRYVGRGPGGRSPRSSRCRGSLPPWLAWSTLRSRPAPRVLRGLDAVARDLPSSSPCWSLLADLRLVRATAMQGRHDLGAMGPRSCAAAPEDTHDRPVLELAFSVAWIGLSALHGSGGLRWRFARTGAARATQASAAARTLPFCLFCSSSFLVVSAFFLYLGLADTISPPSDEEVEC